MSDDDAWVAPKRYGHGAGLPIRWQGWATLAAFFAVILIAHEALMRGHWLIYGLLVAADVAAIVRVTARHTRGGWRWRSGERD